MSEQCSNEFRQEVNTCKFNVKKLINKIVESKNREIYHIPEYKNKNNKKKSLI